MSYQVIARKWRPQKFSDLVGQEHVTETLANAIKNDRVAHAYIFSGARGVGKTTAARILAKALNCVHGPTPTPCGECDSCREIAAGTSLDVIEIDAASNRGIDQIRELREMVRYAPASSRSKVVILDEAHMLTGEASNALLKTLEEPPDRVTFVMATTQPEDLVDTIRSRSQHFHFRALTFGEITARLEEIAHKENLKIDAGALAVISRMAEGSMRDALSLLEQARAYCGEVITNDAVRELLGVVPDDALATLVSAIAEGSADRALGLIHTFQKEGRNLQHFCREAIRHMRNMLIAKVCGADSDLIAATADQRPALAEAAALFSEEDLTRFFQILLQTDDDLRRKPDPRVHLEMGLLRLINAARLAPLEELLTEIKSGTGGGVGSGSPVPARRAASASAAAAGASANSSVRTSSATPTASSISAAAPATHKAENVPGMSAATEVAVPMNNNAAAVISGRDSSTSAPVVSTFRDSTTGGVAPHSNGAFSSQEREAENRPSGNGGIADTANENAGNGLRCDGITAEQVAQIKTAVQTQQKFLGELLEHATTWELAGAELKLYFPAGKKSFAEMLEGRDSLEKLRGISSNVLGRGIRVCAKLAASTSPQPVMRTGSEQQELRAKFERDPMVRSILQRFGGKISEVRRAQEE
ncbi:MAG: polymerase subunit gamma/tau [Acidobacteriaceae bacterium]|jgi:DNA polymerase-3 subunit gamma/tau|nr:polymerase subunit gamma/tau [Acidobacteriaceae bacterium]